MSPTRSSLKQGLSSRSSHVDSVRIPREVVAASPAALVASAVRARWRSPEWYTVRNTGRFVEVSSDSPFLEVEVNGELYVASSFHFHFPCFITAGGVGELHIDLASNDKKITLAQAILQGKRSRFFSEVVQATAGLLYRQEQQSRIYKGKTKRAKSQTPFLTEALLSQRCEAYLWSFRLLVATIRVKIAAGSSFLDRSTLTRVRSESCCASTTTAPSASSKWRTTLLVISCTNKSLG